MNANAAVAADAETIRAYDRSVEKYRQMVTKMPEKKALSRFIDLLPKSALILDLGCGLGDSAAAMQQAGLQVDCMDASPEMVRAAKELFGIEAHQASFADLDAKNHYDGIWANFSLLHASKAAFAGHLGAIATALKAEGMFFLALKLGEGEERDSLGRFYAYYSQEELERLLQATGFSITERLHGSNIGLAGVAEPWIGIFCRKSDENPI